MGRKNWGGSEAPEERGSVDGDLQVREPKTVRKKEDVLRAASVGDGTPANNL